MAVDREAFLRFGNRRYCEVPAPWFGDGATVRIQSLTEKERNAIEQTLEGAVSPRARLVIATVVDDAGHTIFTDAHAELIEGLDAQVVAALVDAISEHCDLNGSRLNKVKDEAKN